MVMSQIRKISKQSKMAVIGGAVFGLLDQYNKRPIQGDLYLKEMFDKLEQMSEEFIVLHKHKKIKSELKQW